jgi:TrmH family RNA methyltransferase
MPKLAPRVVLIEPAIAGNLGFCARALENFGVDDWVQVGGIDWHGSEAERTGSPAPDTLAQLKLAPTLADAVADCSHLIAFSARPRRHREALPVTELASLRQQWGDEAKVGLVFGREDRGLENHELDACTVRMQIPTQDLASLNLSHAVAIVLYEWRRSEATQTASSPYWSDTADRLRLVEKLRQELLASGFQSDGEDLEGCFRRTAALPMETRDLRILERMLRHARWCREAQA